jgi:hypothetical protein
MLPAKLPKFGVSRSGAAQTITDEALARDARRGAGNAFDELYRLSKKINHRHIWSNVFRRKAWELRSHVHFGVELRLSISGCQLVRCFTLSVNSL